MFPSPYVLVACVAGAVCVDARRDRGHANTPCSTVTLVETDMNIPGLPYTDLPESGGHVKHRGAKHHPVKHNQAELSLSKHAKNHESQRPHFHAKSEGGDRQATRNPAKHHRSKTSKFKSHKKQHHAKKHHAKDFNEESEHHTDRHPVKRRMSRLSANDHPNAENQKQRRHSNHSSHHQPKHSHAEYTKTDHHATKRLSPTPPQRKHSLSSRPSVEHPDTRRPRSKHRHAEHSLTQYRADKLPDSEHSDTKYSSSKHSHPEYYNATHSNTEHHAAGHRESEHYDSKHPDQERSQSNHYSSQSHSKHHDQEHSHPEHSDEPPGVDHLHENPPSYLPHSNSTPTNNSPASHSPADYNPADYIPIKHILPCHTPNQSRTDTTPARQSQAPHQRPFRKLPPMQPDQEILLLVHELAGIAQDTIEAKESVEGRLRVLLRSLCQCLLPDEAEQCNILMNTSEEWTMSTMQNKMAAALSKPKKQGQDWAFYIMFFLTVLINVGLANLARIYRRGNVNEYPSTEFSLPRAYSSL
ncbi:hypothetical protein E2C01_048294 [Portunus trituberculatus]|uniref:Uncharacterized protein n=1 Tax=Portunus trituberculatus TaxID=210409 RepID=A0A5B7G610_PORTR|nr:hypothetical protein [Portunus trituberculatus]